MIDVSRAIGKTCYTALTCLLFMATATASPCSASAQHDPMELTELSLEELMSIQVTSVSKGLQALKLLRNTLPELPYDLVIMDYHMPEMDGMELARILQADTALTEIPRIMLSSVSQVGNKRESTSLGISFYLTKPIRRDQLLGCLKQVLNTAGHADKTLVIYDDMTIRFMVAEALEEAEFRVEEVDDRSASMDAFERLRPDTILMDVIMPSVDGFTVYRCLLSLPEVEHISHTHDDWTR
jgi:CheY-like chemotaxis protein